MVTQQQAQILIDSLNVLRTSAGTGNISEQDILTAVQTATNLNVSDNLMMGIYKMFHSTADHVTNPEIVTTGMWTGDLGSLTSFFTSSTQVASNSGKYYWNVYQANPSASNAEVQFAIAYGHRLSSGSITLDLDDNATFPTLGIYGQYRTLLLENTGSTFPFVSSTPGTVTGSNDIYVINFARARYREQVDAGNLEFNLSGSNGVFTFIDNSGRKFSEEGPTSLPGRVFDIVSGSLNLGTAAEPTIVASTASNGAGFGLFYPEQGMIILNPSSIHTLIGTSIGTGSVGGQNLDLSTNADTMNQSLLFNALKGGGDFEARRTETVNTHHYFVRVRNGEFNYSNNPTFRDSVTNRVIEPIFERNPKVFITTVGLYDTNNNLLAVGKMSQPIAKDFSKEVLIKIRLDF
jgi:hypothetical protein